MTVGSAKQPVRLNAEAGAGRDPAVYRSYLSQHAANPGSVRAGAGVKPAATMPIIGKLRIPAWGPSLPWAIAVSVVAAVAIFSIGGPSEFLYWQFQDESFVLPN